ncbi:MAG: efflux RND transporter permease subunit [Opitutales bacterium]|nr:efflux RND transporter permease subunit [Opitutales bacterium]
MIAWFVRNGVAANLIMIIVAVGGFVALPQLRVELFPEISLDQVLVRVVYPGATPNEVEEGIVLRVEEAVQGVQGIRRISSTASESVGTVAIEALRGYDIRRLKDDIKTRVDAIDTFPVNAERPIIEELIFPRDVLYIAVAGETDEVTLRRMAERVRDEIVAVPGISQAELVGVRSFEIAIEVSESALRAYGLTFDEVAEAVSRHSLDLPGGSIRAASGEILLRTLGQAYEGAEFAAIPLRSGVDGARVQLGDVARIVDGFVDQDRIAAFDGSPAAFVLVRQVSTESPLDISRKVEAYLDEARGRFPEGIALSTFADTSFYLADRIALLVKNGLIGLILVVAILTAFLRPLLAFFVALGIPVSFLGAFLVAPYFDVSINLISLFAFILVLGIVVDDAIVVGESVFSEFQHSKPGPEAAIRGSLRVAKPVTFAVLTTMVAFVPVFFIPGTFGKFLAPIPVVVIATLAWSLVQSKLVLPYHLSLLRVGTRDRARLNAFNRVQRRIADALEACIERLYRPSLRWSMERRYLTLAAFAGVFIISFGVLAGGWVRFVPQPSVPSDYIVANLEYPMGTPIETTRRGLDRMRAALVEVTDQLEREGEPNAIDHDAIFMQGDTHTATYLIEMSKSEARDVSAFELARRWREAVGELPGARSLVFTAEAGATPEKAIDIQLTGRDFEAMRNAAREIREGLRDYPAVFDVADNFSSGKREVRIRTNPAAADLGISTADLGRQVRQAFFGAEAQRIQRGRNDVRVMVRYPRDERESLANLEDMRVRLPDGTAVPFAEVADISLDQGFATIKRIDRNRVLNITADIDREATDFTALVREIQNEMLPEILARHPGVESTLEGEAAETRETLASLLLSTLLMLFIIYALLAIPFRSYLQPLIVMAAIPFALVGAVIGHIVTFQNLSILSILGLVAAFGVVVNASLVMVDFVNQNRREGADRMTAVMGAGAARFRPIVLTSLTTFAGLTPILLERSLQAQFLIPMATSLAFGVLFASFITLYLVPALYLALEDVKRFLGRLFGMRATKV